MKKITMVNETGLAAWLSENAIPYEVLQDGWRISIEYTNELDLFNIGRYWGRYQQSVSIPGTINAY